MLSTLPMENTTFFPQVVDKLAAFHKATLELGSFSSVFSQPSLWLSAPADFLV